MKYIFYVLGIGILALGISLMIQSKIGTSPFDALLVGLSVRVGLTVGSWEIIIALMLIGLNAVVQRQKPEWLGMITALLTGAGIDMWLMILQHGLTPELWYSRWLCFGMGLVTTGLGTAVYLYTNFAAIPIDRLSLVLQQLLRTNMLVARTVVYMVFLIMGLMLGGPIGVGTVLTVGLGGVVLQYFMPVVGNLLDRVL
ncbi:YczE/YyaS/YitT family protein [Paenibacillus wulumuqiensis]|uniref:YczE/YyaS/YitT family protein n=1 Tax=Paenibacillus wulumuqiensis TaxID=1567107 RepID=UPI0006190CA4|nr:hypothetical protein [Paenibacillus wulumuqiensis]